MRNTLNMKQRKVRIYTKLRINPKRILVLRICYIIILFLRTNIEFSLVRFVAKKVSKFKTQKNTHITLLSLKFSYLRLSLGKESEFNGSCPSVYKLKVNFE